jgi:hypothetical protein
MEGQPVYDAGLRAHYVRAPYSDAKKALAILLTALIVVQDSIMRIVRPFGYHPHHEAFFAQPAREVRYVGTHSNGRGEKLLRDNKDTVFRMFQIVHLSRPALITHEAQRTREDTRSTISDDDNARRYNDRVLTAN